MADIKVLKDKLGNILNPKIPRYEKEIEYFTSSTTNITFTPKYDCYAEITCVSSTWGNGGNVNTLSIDNTSGSAEKIFMNTCTERDGNLISRPLISNGVWKCEKGKSYTFTRVLSWSGGESSLSFTAKLIPMK